MSENKQKTPPTLLQRLISVMRELSYVQKTVEIKSGSFSYSALSHDHVTRLVREKFVEFGIYCHTTIEGSSIDHYQVEAKYGTQERYETKVTVKVTLYNIDDKSDFLESRYIAHGFDSQDKSPGKAMSMAVKYALLKLLMLESGDQEEERIEESRRVDKEQLYEIKNARKELRDLLEKNNKYNSKAENYLMKLNLQEVYNKIKELKGE